MERNTDWKLPAALILAGLALLVALSGRNALPFMDGGSNQAVRTTPYEGSQPGIVIWNNGSGGPANTMPAPTVVLPNAPAVAVPGVPELPYHFGQRFGFSNGFSPLRFILPALLILLAFCFFRRRNWQRHGRGPFGAGAWQGWQGQQPQQPQQPHQSWRGQQPQQTQQSSQPGERQGRWVWHDDAPIPPAPPTPPAPPSPSYSDNYGDITRPGQGNQA